jgi:hypothetical protein
MRLRSRLKLAISLVILTALVAFLWNPVTQAFRVAALRQCAGGVGKLDSRLYLESDERPYRFVQWVAPVADGLIKKVPASQKAWADRLEGYHQQFHFLFQPPIEGISVAGPLKDDPGRVLARFPRLKRLVIYEKSTETGMTGDEWAQLCRGLRACPQLAHLNMGGVHLDDAAIAELAGHPTLRSLSVHMGHLTPACTEALGTIPNLKEFYVSKGSNQSKAPVDPKHLATMSAALPHVRVQLY